MIREEKIPRCDFKLLRSWWSQVAPVTQSIVILLVAATETAVFRLWLVVDSRLSKRLVVLRDGR